MFCQNLLDLLSGNSLNEHDAASIIKSGQSMRSLKIGDPRLVHYPRVRWVFSVMGEALSSHPNLTDLNIEGSHSSLLTLFSR